MMSQEKQSFQGTGWHFPIKFSALTKDPVMVSNADCIAQNIRMLLSTRQGERPMFPAYGHQLYTMSFEVISQTLIYRIKEHLEYIFMMYEPRITLEEIDIQTNSNEEQIVYIHLEYRIRETNTRTNMVFPYYLIEK
ncbi:MAG: GPW/gp25 family protein [Bacteroidota bacterium]